MINEYVFIYLVFASIASIVCFDCFDGSYSLTRHVCLFCSAFAPQQWSIVNTSFPPSATGTPQQQQLQPERDTTMAIAMSIVTYRQQHGNREKHGPTIIFYHHKQCQHVRYQEHCHHDGLPSKCNWNTVASAATATGRRLDNNGNGNRDTQTTTWWQSRNRIADQQATPLHKHGRAGE